MQVKFGSNFVNTQRYAGSGTIEATKYGLKVVGRKERPIFNRLAMAIVLWIGLVAIFRHTLVWLIELHFVWEIASLVGRRKTTETIPYSAIREVRMVEEKGALLRVQGDESFKIRFRGKKFQVDALVGILEARMGSQNDPQD